MRKLYALLIAIDNYPLPRHRLQGCRQDLQDMYAFLEAYCGEYRMAFQPLVLKDEQATRAAVIRSFKHFEAAGEQDSCLFYFSGHGARSASPREFWHLDLDRKGQCLVCYDSRTPGGYDLIDKELSYLIWRHVPHASTHFLALFDCCHSGAATRGLDGRPRMAESQQKRPPFNELAGSRDYLLRDGKVYPPARHHIALSASRPYEVSFEGPIEGRQRGVFTYALLRSLKAIQLEQLTYQQLADRAGIEVNAMGYPQHPQLGLAGSVSGQNIFLRGQLCRRATFPIVYDDRQGRWLAMQGAIHGIEAGQRVRVTATGGQRLSATVAAVEPGLSVLEGMEGADPSREYQAYFEWMKKSRAKVALVDSAGQAGGLAERLQMEMKALGFPLSMTALAEEAQYCLQPEGGRLQLFRPGSPAPLHQWALPSIYEEAELASCLRLAALNIWEIHNWALRLRLANAETRLIAEEMAAVTFIERAAGDPQNRQAERDISKHIQLNYRRTERGWVEPQIKVSVKNTSAVPLWVAGLYFGEDYSIKDVFLRPRELAPGSEPYPFTLYWQGKAYDAISLFIDEKDYAAGTYWVDNHIKIIASTAPFSTTSLCQDALSQSLKSYRSIDFRLASLPQSDDWFTIDISFSIHRPPAEEG